MLYVLDWLESMVHNSTVSRGLGERDRLRRLVLHLGQEVARAVREAAAE
jgi:hypothetical protein